MLCVCVINHVRLFLTCQAPLSMEFSRQEYWSGLRDSKAWNVKDGEEKSTWAMFNVPVQPLSFAEEKSG